MFTGLEYENYRRGRVLGNPVQWNVTDRNSETYVSVEDMELLKADLSEECERLGITVVIITSSRSRRVRDRTSQCTKITGATAHDMIFSAYQTHTRQKEQKRGDNRP